MWVVGLWILAFLNWLLPVQRPVSVRLHTLTSTPRSAWHLRHGLTLHRLALIHPPTHRRRL
jgi:hypothetical protein